MESTERREAIQPSSRRSSAKAVATLVLAAVAALSFQFADFHEYGARMPSMAWASKRNETKRQPYCTEANWTTLNISTTTIDSKDTLDLLISVHQSDYPALEAGQWVYRPEEAFRPTKQHLQCLVKETQGNCYDSHHIKNGKVKRNRLHKVETGQITNSEGILAAKDPWVWESEIEQYKVLPYCLLHNPETRNVLFTNSNRTIYLIGDSLTRQWWQSMLCDAQHIFGMTLAEANRTIQFHQDYMGMPSKEDLDHFLRDSMPQDYFIFNFGHHPDPAKLGEEWKQKYHEILVDAFTTSNFGKIPPHHIFFRTTSVRHFLYGKGDWNTNSSSSGGASANMTAQWNMYGGQYPAQPQQNLIALELFQNLTSNHNNNNSIQVGGILDTSPMMLARADATFDGSHFCLPGPIDYWSCMLYYRIYAEEMTQGQ